MPWARTQLRDYGMQDAFPAVKAGASFKARLEGASPVAWQWWHKLMAFSWHFAKSRVLQSASLGFAPQPCTAKW